MVEQVFSMSKFMTKINEQKGSFFEGQLAHLVCMTILLLALYGAFQLSYFKSGSFFGLSGTAWVTLAVTNAILHQVYVWLCWRSELDGQHVRRILENMLSVSTK